MAPDYALMSRLVRKHKAALTRAKKVGPGAVMVACDKALSDFDDHGYPDNWHLWQMARYDAEVALRRSGAL